MTKLDTIRLDLTRWGRWWSQQERKRLGFSSVGSGQKLVDLARYGCLIDKPVYHDRPEDILPPHWVLEIDAAVQDLSPAQKAALCLFYIRSGGHLPRRRVRSRALLRAEIRVLQSI